MSNNIYAINTKSSEQALCALPSNQCVKWIVFSLHFKTTTYAGRYE